MSRSAIILASFMLYGNLKTRQYCPRGIRNSSISPVFSDTSRHRYMGVVSIVKKKMDQVKFAAMLACFMKRACSVECQRVARLVGNVDDDPEQFAVQTKEEYIKLVKIQGDEKLETLNVETLRGKGRELDSSEHGHQGMDGTRIEQLCTFSQKVTRMLKYVSVRLAQLLDASPVHPLAPSQNIINVPCIFIIRCSSSVT